MPAGKLVKIGVWENNKFIGCILYGDGILGSSDKFLGYDKFEVAELVRIALNKHETPVSKLIKISIKKLKEVCPKLRLLVSFADNGQNHHGGIYQASNWIYTGSKKTGGLYKHKTTSKIYHDRGLSNTVIRKC